MQIQIRVKTGLKANTEAKTKEVMISKGTLLDQLKEIGVELSPQHPCRRDGGCGVSVDYDARLAATVIKHRLGDKWTTREMDDILRADDNKWGGLVAEALAQMHMAGSGIYRDGDAYKVITPYIDPNDAIEMASEIYGHTGLRITIP